MVFSTTQIIAAPRNKVFNFFYDDKNLKNWVPEFIGNEYPEGFDKSNPVGKPFVHILKEGRRVTRYNAEVLEFEAPRRLSTKVWNKAFTMVISYTLTEEGENATRLDYSVTTSADSAFIRFLGWVFAGFTRSIARKQLARLKTLVEEK